MNCLISVTMGKSARHFIFSTFETAKRSGEGGVWEGRWSGERQVGVGVETWKSKYPFSLCHTQYA